MPRVLMWMKLMAIGSAVFLNIALWTNWENVFPEWGRVLAALLAVTGAISAVMSRRKPSVFLTACTLVAASCCCYLLLPLNGESVASQLQKSSRHLFSRPRLTESPQLFAQWVAAGPTIHQRSRLFLGWFRTDAEAELRRSLLSTQQHLRGASVEIAVYNEWHRVMSEFLQTLDVQEEPVQRMNQILKASQKVRQAFSDCQDAVREGDYERLKAVKAKLQSDSELASLDGHLGHLVKQISAEAERLELLHSAGDAE